MTKTSSNKLNLRVAKALQIRPHNIELFHSNIFKFVQKHMMLMNLRDYYYLTKPGIIRGNLLTAAAGFLLGSGGQPKLMLLFLTLLAISLVIASACVVNNITDRKIDKKMSRTKNRAFARGSLSLTSGIIYASALGLAGFSLLALATNPITLILGVIGYVDYTLLYALTKRHSPAGTLVGSISGAIPPAAGYTAAGNGFDVTAALLILILLLWQMPHFYSISIYRQQDYKAAAIPVLSTRRKLKALRITIVGYIIAFTVAVSALALIHKPKPLYLTLTGGLILGIGWLYIAFQTDRPADAWAKKVFLASLAVISVLCLVISLNSFTV